MSSNGQELQPAGTIQREGIDGMQELEVLPETAASAVAAQAEAMIKARYALAIRNPRDLDEVRVRLLKECQRPSLAECAIYSKPIGGKPIEGLSIRFVETALRCMRNVVCEKMTIFDGRDKRIVRVTVSDLEANLHYPTDITVEKTVERKNLTDGRVPISSRKNSNGQVTYLVPATEDELLVKESALASKAIRVGGLRIIPGDLQDECEEILRRTMRQRDAQDPDTARRKLTDAFASLNIMPSDLAKYLGADVGTASPAQIEELRLVYAAIKQGEATWRDVLAAKTETPLEDEKPKADDPKVAALKEQLEKKKAAASAKTDEKPAETKQPESPKGDDSGGY